MKEANLDTFSDIIFNSLPGNCVTINSQGNIVKVNLNWNKFAIENGVDSNMNWIGQNYLEVCKKLTGISNESAGEACTAIKAILGGEESEFELEYPGQKSSKEQWFRMQATGFEFEGSFYATIIHQDIADRSEVDKKIRESEENNRTLIEQANEGVVVIQDGVVKFVNTAITKITGYSIDELMESSFIKFIAKSEVENVQKKYIKRMNGELVPPYESKIIGKDGNLIEVEFYGGLTYYKGAVADLDMVRDISERKKAEEERNRLFNLSSDLIGIAGFDGYFKQLNPAWEVTLGYTPDELMAKPFLDFIHPDDHNKNDEEVGKLSEGHKTIDFVNRYIHKDGSIRHIFWTVTPLPKEGTIYCIGRNITERKIVKDAIAENEEKFRLLVEQSPLPILIFNTDGYLDQVNLSWQKMWGLSDAELKQVLDHYNILSDELLVDYSQRELILKAFNGKPVVLPLVEYDGKETMDRFGKKIEAKKVWIIARYYPVKNKKGEVVKVVGMVEDYTERKLWEQETLNYQQQLKDLALELTYAEEKQRKQIAADLHDDVGQLLASSRMQIATIDATMDKNGILDKVKEISTGLRDAITATQQAIFELRPPLLNDIGLEAALADWMEEELETKHGISALLLGEDKKYDLNDEVRYLLFRCLRELLINVIKHARATRVVVGFNEKDEELSISVHDNGIGIDYDSDMAGLKGSGFGLFSIRERIQNIGGTVEIDAVKGIGTKITLTLAASK